MLGCWTSPGSLSTKISNTVTMQCSFCVTAGVRQREASIHLGLRKIRTAARCYVVERRPACAPAGIRWRARRDPRGAALDVPVVFSRAADGQIPGAVIGHRTLDRKHAAIVIGYDQEERFGRIGVGHGVIIRKTTDLENYLA
jgi:hypothetical protein